jgi:GMP synthase (glutamine-hydrolysing)
MSKLNIHYFQHVHFENLGSIEEWAVNNGHRLTATRFYESDEMPDIHSIDWLIIMGGPMGVHDTEEYPWLVKEKAYIQNAIQANKTVIGICLGSQLIADVLGAKVYRNKHPEIGWFPINFTAEASKNKCFDGWEGSLQVFHWHGDTFDLPKNAVHLASSEATKNQAFLYGQKVLGLQFHVETTQSSLQYMITGSDEELKKDLYVQTPGEIAQGAGFIDENQRLLFKTLDALSNI